VYCTVGICENIDAILSCCQVADATPPVHAHAPTTQLPVDFPVSGVHGFKKCPNYSKFRGIRVGIDVTFPGVNSYEARFLPNHITPNADDDFLYAA